MDHKYWRIGLWEEYSAVSYQILPIMPQKPVIAVQRFLQTALRRCLQCTKIDFI